MNASKNYNNKCLALNLTILGKQICLALFILFICNNIQAAEHITRSSSAINTADYIKVLLGLVFVIALFLISSHLFKRYGNGSMTGRGQIRLVDGLHLGNRERLVLVELKDKQILLSVTPGQINKLDTITITPAEETD